MILETAIALILGGGGYVERAYNDGHLHREVFVFNIVRNRILIDKAMSRGDDHGRGNQCPGADVVIVVTQPTQRDRGEDLLFGGRSATKDRRGDLPEIGLGLRFGADQAPRGGGQQ